jgi:ABC-type sugar transport system substrate-binding protein
MKRTTYLLIVLTILMSFILGACAQPTEAPVVDDPAEETEAPEVTFKVGYINADLENPAWNAVATGFTDRATELGMDAIAVSSSGQASTQYEHAQDMVTKEYDAVALSGTDSSSANATVAEFNNAGIPVWILHIAPDDPNVDYVSMVDAQNKQGNYDAGKYLAETYEARGMTGTAATITISLARSNGQARHAGFEEAMNEAGIEIVEIKEAITYTRDESYQFTQDLIAANPDLSIIWCNYDEAVLGAMKAIEDAGKQDEILVGGFDGSPESLKAVMDGRINVMAVQPLYTHGMMVAEQMYEWLVNGVEPESVSTDCPLVTTENAETEAPKYLEACFGPTAEFPGGEAAPEEEPVSEEPEATAEGMKVGYINADLENPAWNAVATGFTDRATELGFEAIAVSSSGQASTQYEHAQDMVTKEYDAVALSGTDSSSANATVAEFNNAGIPVWILHIAPDDPNVDYVSMIDAQNKQGNYDAGKYLAETYNALGMTGTAATITISLARSNGQARHAGFEEAMNEAGIEIVEIKEAITYTRDESYQFTQDLIAANPDLSIIWCNYDEAVLGAMKAIEDAGKAGEILVGGFDGSPESLKAVMDGRINVMAVQPLYTHGMMVAEQMFEWLVNGVEPESVSTDCPLVTTENAETEAPKYLEACFGPTAEFPE